MTKLFQGFALALSRTFLFVVVLLLSGCGNPYEQGNAALKKLDFDTALSKFKEASNNGNVDATLQLAQMLRKGQGGGVNEEEAVRWYKIAADKGNAEAMFNLGEMFYKGYLPSNGGRVVLSKEEGLRWYTLAADKGHTGAQYISAWFLMNDLTKDQSRVLGWLKNAVLSGVKVKDWSHPIGSLVMFYYGKKDYLKAYKWALIYRSRIDDPIEKNKFDFLIKEIEEFPNYSESKCLNGMAAIKKYTRFNVSDMHCEKQENVNINSTDLNQAADLAIQCLANNLRDCN